MKTIKRIAVALANERAGVVYLVLSALAMAVATFIENDFGTEAAQKWIYKAMWFEVLLLLLGVSVGFSALKYKLWQRKRYSVLLFHASVLVILLGAGITRIWGFEGMMGIREGAESNKFISSEPYLSVQIQDPNGQSYGTQQEVLFSSLGGNSFDKTYRANGIETKLHLLKFVPNAVEEIVESDTGKPTLKLVFSSDGGRLDAFISLGEKKEIAGIPVNFTQQFLPGHVNFFYQDSQYFIRTDAQMKATRMATQEIFEFSADTGMVPLLFRSLYQLGGVQFVVPSVSKGGEKKYVSSGLKMNANSEHALQFEISQGNSSKILWVKGSKGQVGETVPVDFGSWRFLISYGSIYKELPFSIALQDFEMERYPGTNSPASFSSKVQLRDPNDAVSLDYHIYMNHILDYGGYRFFQSSYDRDEEGTYLSVNHDFWGTWISYLGYFLLTVGMIWTLLDKNTRFYSLRKSTKLGLWILMFFANSTVKADVELKAQLKVASESHAQKVSTVLVQDVQGRMKPMHTFSREIMRKVYGSESYEGYNADQVILGFWGARDAWYAVPIIKLGNDSRLKSLIVNENATHASFRDFFDESGDYKLGAVVDESSRKKDSEKNTFDKALIALDERVSIVNLLMTGALFKWVPIADDPNNTWSAAHQHGNNNEKVVTDFFDAYLNALHDGILHSDYTKADLLLNDLYGYQIKMGSDYIPSLAQRKWEVFLNETLIFKRLAFVNTILGLCFLGLLFWYIFKEGVSGIKLKKLFLGIAFVSFAAHTLGLAVRWYVSERAPWSNGYESMIYIAWTAVLAGLIFNRKSVGALSATFILSGITLFIAHLSFLNPEITPLVPVLKSYWLTIHVSLEAGSYGFLLLGGIIGYLNLLLFSVVNKNNAQRVKATVNQLTILSELTITGGLIMLSIGTYLGGVWANESWGRYWGWDAKETWALISILVYAFILHMRLIPKLKGNFAFNIASIVGFASVLMTYYGVNYYLSGLHSYAAGDPVPIPQWVYWALAGVVVTALFARRGNSKLSMMNYE
jgi:cytochrome c-type biogenesis protein CcsB